MELPYTAEEVNRALQRLDLAYIVGRDPDGVHRYRVPLFIDMIREWDLDLALAEECEAARSAENVTAQVCGSRKTLDAGFVA